MKKFLLLLSLWVAPLAYCNDTTGTIKDMAVHADKGVATVYADGKGAVTTIYNDAKAIAPEIASNIKGIAQELKVGADHVWNILVLQQRVWSIGFLFLTIGSIVNWILFYRRNLNRNISLPKDTTFITLQRDIIGDIPNDKYDQYYANRGEQYKDDIRSQTHIKGPVGKEEYSCPQIITKPADQSEGFNDFVKVMHLLLCLGLTGLSIYNFSSMLTGFINPEFGAMKDIILFTTSLKH